MPDRDGVVWIGFANPVFPLVILFSSAETVAKQFHALKNWQFHALHAYCCSGVGKVTIPKFSFHHATSGCSLPLDSEWKWMISGALAHPASGNVNARCVSNPMARVGVKMDYRPFHPLDIGDQVHHQKLPYPGLPLVNVLSAELWQFEMCGCSITMMSLVKECMLRF